MAIILVSYAGAADPAVDRKLLEAQSKLHDSMPIGKVDRGIMWNRCRLMQSELYLQHKEILDQPRGGGFWLWKPYIILDALLQAKPSDAVVYWDVGRKTPNVFTRSVEPLAQWCREHAGLLPGVPILPQGKWTKRDCFVQMNCDSPRYWKADQIQATFSVWSGEAAFKFVGEWLKWCQDRRCLTDSPNESGLPNLDGFQEHRHDQSILTNLCIKHGLAPLPALPIPAGVWSKNINIWSEALSPPPVVANPITVPIGNDEVTHAQFAKSAFERGDLPSAEISYRLSLASNPQHIPAWRGLSRVLCRQARHHEGVTCLQKAVGYRPNNLQLHSELLYAMEFLDDAPQEQFLTVEDLPSLVQQDAPDRTINRKLRVGYLLPNLDDHYASHLLEALLEFHDRGAFGFDATCYSLSENQSDTMVHLRCLADSWRDISGCSLEQAAQTIQNDQIDILVDLTGSHRSSHKILLTARPVPIIFHLNDLSRLMLCWRPPNNTIDPAITDETNVQITFGFLGNPMCITKQSLELWCQILKAVPDSRLILHCDFFFPVLLQTLSIHSIAANRVAIVKQFKHREHRMEIFKKIDIALDAVPCVQDTSFFEACWMGVPVIALSDESPKFRICPALLKEMNSCSRIAHSKDEFLTIAIHLAQHQSPLKISRQTIRDRFSTSFVTGTSTLVKKVEAKYLRLCKLHARENS